MNKQIGCFLVLIGLFFFNYSESQDLIKAEPDNHADVFLDQDILPIKLSYDMKEIKRNTNDSTYIDSHLEFQLKDGSWQTLPVELRRRGNNRLKNCYFAPIKVKIKKSDAEYSPFEGHKSFKIVLPCLLQSDKNDNVLKEYLAYKLFEIISPYHFKTRLTAIEFEDDKGKKAKVHNLKSFLVEDDKTLAKRLNAKVYHSPMHPLNQEALSSLRNAFFQYMIGNTDFSQAYHHNIKVVYIDNNMIPIPYDFDMAGFVNCSYAVVSVIQGESLGMASVTERKYRGFVREVELMEKVRQEFMDNKNLLVSVLDAHAHFFDDSREFKSAKDYILGFFDVMVNSTRFKSEILEQARKE